ncbi:MAG: DMT family transporter [Planctomycetes bacterium]|nr:DMT family transporter [Planctomycetota bacterium]
MPYRGELFALLTAMCFTGSGLLFAVASKKTGPLPANHFRLAAGVPALLVICRLLTGEWWPFDLSTERAALLVASGLVGLVLGDIGFFHALATVGPRISTVVMATWPAVTVAIAAVQGRLPDWPVLLGITMTIAGVALVLLRSPDGASWRPGITRRMQFSGIAGALLGAVGQAIGFELAGLGMAAAADAPTGVDPLQATVVRMTAALVGLQLVATVQHAPAAFVAVVHDRRALQAAAWGALFGPIGGVTLSMMARKHAAVPSVAGALIATTPVFMMPVARFVYGARIGALGVLGTLVAVAGVAVCLLNRR